MKKESRSASVSFQISLTKLVIISALVIIPVAYCFIISYNALNKGGIDRRVNFEETDKKEIIYAWYEDIGVIKGPIKDEGFFIVEPNFAFNEKDAEKISNEIFNKRFIIIDSITKWFYETDKDYLLDPNNRTAIRYDILDLVNSILSYKIEDVRFTTYNIENIN